MNMNDILRAFYLVYFNQNRNIKEVNHYFQGFPGGWTNRNNISISDVRLFINKYYTRV